MITTMMTEKDWAAHNVRRKNLGAHVLGVTAFAGGRISTHWLMPNGQIAQDNWDMDGMEFPSLTAELPEVAWDEREIHDMFGYRPKGHLDLRALVRNPRWPDGFYPLAGLNAPRKPQWLEVAPNNPAQTVEGEGVTIMKVGPTHAGIIEAGHFVFSIIGENILHVDLHLFQNHRGVEGQLQGRPIGSVCPIISRICGADTVSHQTNLAMAVEEMVGYQVPDEIQWQRILLLESERILSHLNDLAQIPAGVGFSVANQRALAMKERWQRGLDVIFGHRLLFDTVQAGKPLDMDTQALGTLIVQLQREWRPWRSLVQGHHGFQDRMQGVGTVRQSDALRFGGQGIVARASGVTFDARQQMPLYQSWHVDYASEASGDVFSRFKVRLDEVEASWRLMERVLQRIQIHSALPVWEPPPDLAGQAVTFSESPHGLNAHIVAVDRGQVIRYHVRSGTFRNWPLLAKAVAGNAVGDFPLINKSFELCYSCLDR